jgi:hypothetical protein
LNNSEKTIVVLQAQYPDVNFYISDGQLVWMSDDIEQPTDEQIQSWIAELKEPPNWDRLLKESGPFMVKAQSTTNANGFALLLSTLTNIRSVQYLEIALTQIRSAMKQPYTAKELSDLNKLIADCNIELILQ